MISVSNRSSDKFSTICVFAAPQNTCPGFPLGSLFSPVDFGRGEYTVRVN
jgi:hypothetical protein